MYIEGKNVIVTGGAGFIGSHLVDLLLKRNARVIILDDLSAGSMRNVDPRAVFFECDVTDINKVQRCLEDVDVIFHLAADASTKESSMGWDTPAETLRVNVIGTANILKSVISLRSDAKVICASSAAVYGEPESIPIREDHPTNPISPYGISKLAAEKLAFASFREFGVDVTSVRIFNTYGPRQPRYVIFDLLRKLEADHRLLEVMGGPDIVRDYCYVSDLTEGLVVVAERGISGEIYNISGRNPVTLSDLVNLILLELNLSGKTVVSYTGKSWKGDIARMVADISKVTELGFRPKTDLREGIRRMVEWRSCYRTEATSSRDKRV